MMIGTNNNIMLAYNSLNATNNAIEKTSRALSTGLKAAQASDDAAGFAMTQNISAQISGVNRAIRNSQDGISMLQTADGALNEINSMLQRMRELSVQAANDTLTTQDRSYIQLEMNELREGIDNIAHNTTFNCKRLLDGSSAAEWTADNLDTKVHINGAITTTDKFGQKNTTEGNYRIEISAVPGQGEVQKTNIFNVTTATEYARKEIVTMTNEDGEDEELEVTILDTVIKTSTLADIPAFYNSGGASMLDSPQTITIIQGDGQKADVELYSGDTLYDVAKKINNAIAYDLGQGVYTDNVENFCTISDGTENTSEAVYSQEKAYRKVYVRDEDGNLILNNNNEPQEISVEDYDDYEDEELAEIISQRTLDEQSTKATILIRSAVPGNSGRLLFTSDNQDLINALGLNTIQEARDCIYTSSVYDAHTGKVIAKNINTDENILTGVINPNISIEFDPMANIKASWDNDTKRYILSPGAQPYTTSIHIADRSTAFQIGQNHGEDIYIHIGDMTAGALGLDGINVSTRTRASESIHLLDMAIHKVAVQRDKIGSYQNELEYNANSLTQTSLHLSESESRIKDADMATEMIEFVKLQILNSTGNSMLAQANQNSQSIMSIINM